ncbi:MAG: Uma2 family endonuclease [Planctomycetota bacterium]
MSTHLELNSPLAPPLPLRRFSVAQYHQLGDLGVLTPEDNVELLEGWIVEKMNQRPIHGFIVAALTERFQRGLPICYVVRCQLPITTARSEPEPDVAIVRGSHSDYRERHPVGGDCRLIIEVADTSLEKDRSKAAIYRDAGVQEYWIINVAEKVVERYDFSNAGLQAKVMSADASMIVSLDVQSISIDVKHLFE